MGDVSFTKVVPGEAEQVEYSPWKVSYRVPLFSENGTRLCSFYIVTYSYGARCVELNEVRELGDITPVTYFEIYNVYLGRTERIRQSGDALVDNESLKHLLRKLYLDLDLEEIMQ